MHPYAYPALYCLFVWWFSTGLIVFLNNLPRKTFRWSMGAATAIAGISLYRLATGSHDTSVAGAYAAFTYGVIVWGWHEMAFFMGFLTGPRKTACPRSSRGWRHFGYGVSACLDHELAILDFQRHLIDRLYAAAVHLVDAVEDYLGHRAPLLAGRLAGPCDIYAVQQRNFAIVRR